MRMADLLPFPFEMDPVPTGLKKTALLESDLPPAPTPGLLISDTPLPQLCSSSESCHGGEWQGFFLLWV